MNATRILLMFSKELGDLMDGKSITKTVPIHRGVIENMNKDKYQEIASTTINAIYDAMYDEDDLILKRMLVKAITHISATLDEDSIVK